MFESFTSGAERALWCADQLARRRAAIVVEPLDLLAALAAESESRAAELLAECGVLTDRLWAELEPEILVFLSELEGEAEGRPATAASQLLPPSPDLRLVLNEASMHARGLDRKREVGTEHLLAGLLASSGPASDLLKAAGVEHEILRERLTETTLAETAPLPLADGIAPLDLSEPGGGVDLGRILDASANRRGRACGSPRITSVSCSMIPGSPGDSRKCATGSPRPSAGLIPTSCSARVTPEKTSALTS